MKTTKLINGKTFDEVFAERGEETTVEKMVAGDIYLLGKTYSDDWDILHKHDYIRGSNMYTSGLLFDNGSTHYSGFINCDDVNGIYCATSNQIELLNLYLNHCEDVEFNMLNEKQQHINYKSYTMGFRHEQLKNLSNEK